MKSVLLTCFYFLWLNVALAQPLQSMSQPELLWELQNTGNTGAVLYIAAHPDDENTRLISYLANERHIRTAYMSLTRGDGGQNLIGNEKGPLLGMVRTQELIAARKIDHGTQYFSRAYDFGYSKNPQETFQFWNKDSVLADVVWVIRTFQPDVIICRFPTTGEGGHGHHTASAILAEEAFTAAADPQKFPWQLQHTNTWQAKRIVWNTFNFGGNNTTSEDQLKIDVGGYNPHLGKYNGEIAAESRSMHKSQGFGSEKNRGSQMEYFKHIKGEKAITDLMDGIDVTWTRYPHLKSLKNEIDALIASYQNNPNKDILPQLWQLYQHLQKEANKPSPAKAWLKLHAHRIKRVILGYCQVWADVTTPTRTSVAGSSLKVNYSFINSGKVPITVVKIQTGTTDSMVHIPLSGNKMNYLVHQYLLPMHTPGTTPYWLQQPPRKGMFQVNDEALNTKPFNDPTLSARITFSLLDDTFSIELPVRNKSVDPVKGEIYQPFSVVPPIVVNPPFTSFLFTDKRAKVFPITLLANVDSFSGQLFIEVPKGWAVNPSTQSFTVAKKGEQLVLPVTVIPTEKASDGFLRPIVKTQDKQYNQSLTTIDYDHIPIQQLLVPSEVQLKYEKMIVPSVKLGYIPGAGDEVAALLKEMHMDVTILTDEILATGNLHAYHTIVTGVRAYNTHVKLQRYYARLMDFVKQGGNLIVQYNTNSRVGPLNIQMGPYPFTISRERVTDEQAPVTFLAPKHPLFNKPNVITGKDFEGWVQERGIYFATDWDKHYLPMLRMNDPGEKPLDGALIVAPYGKGNFVYTGLVFFRELPHGVPGAYKLLFNLLALPQHP